VGILRAVLCARGDVVAENLLLRQQLMVLTRPTRRRPRTGARDELFWMLARFVRREWRRHLVLVRPETVVRWHRAGGRLFWSWRSRKRLGRPRLRPEVRALIGRRASQTPAWGSERIRGELLKLGSAASKRTVQPYRRRGPARPPSPTWRSFLANHRPPLRAAALLTVHTLTFRTPYVLRFVAHGRRELLHVTATAHPTAARGWRPRIDAPPWGRPPRSLRRDRDRVDGGDVVHRAKRLGIGTVLAPLRAPRATASAERVIGTLRRACLDHVVVGNEPHLRAVLADFACYHNTERPHRTLHPEPPPPVPRATTGPIHAKPVLGGVHHSYERVA
jgi:hypothetical protein